MNHHVETTELTERQQAVLDAALAAMVEEGDALTMTSVSRRASCSKETLYKWFGDRDGLLTATVRWQASKVQIPALDRAKLDRAALVSALEQFAANWLKVISSETSIALNRMAVSHAASGKTSLGSIVLKNGRNAMGLRLEPVLEAARVAGLLEFEDADEAFRTFFGLVLRDVQIRLLLGDAIKLSGAQIADDAARATGQFMALYGAQNQTKREG
ncbi:MAG: TetR/AcrR family transcriptional regulator C-terminal domain-containing protein [Rhizobiaceae bacterium]